MLLTVTHVIIFSDILVSSHSEIDFTGNFE